MNKEEFRNLFEHALEVAAQNAEKKLGHPVPQQFEIEMHSLSPRTRILKREEVLDEIYLGPDLFFESLTSLSVVSVKTYPLFILLLAGVHPAHWIKHGTSRPAAARSSKCLQMT